ncbi:MAG: LysM peptidoglycan-binding domain-containing protein [Candidatus Obscuribacterales bacterium]|nr:LysM peptidoglycan-binding domain-containing protein [Candidatus Obscuribacterales bacterium]
MTNSGFDSNEKSGRRQNEQPPGADWHPDLSRERPEWKVAHANQKDATLDVSADGIYTVKAGDTIYDIARRSLASKNAACDSASLNHEMEQIVQDNVSQNPKLGTNRDLIHVGDQLKLQTADAASVVNPPPVVENRDAVAPTVQRRDDGALPVQTDATTTDDRQPAPVAPLAPLAPSVPLYDGQPTVQRYDDLPPVRPDRLGADGYSKAPIDYGSNTLDREAFRLSQIMAQDPHSAANEMRDQLSRLDPESASTLVAQTKNYELVGGLGDLQIQREFDQSGMDTGFRNVTMATPDGIEQIAEIQSRPLQSYDQNQGVNPLQFAAGIIVGDLLWQRQRGLDFDDDRYRGWCNREQYRENYWNNNNGQFVQNWQDSNYRQQFQSQNWQQVSANPTINNTYITNNRYDTTIYNHTVNNTVVNNIIQNTSNFGRPRHVIPAPPLESIHPVANLPPVIGTRQNPRQIPLSPAPHAAVLPGKSVEQPFRVPERQAPGHKSPEELQAERDRLAKAEHDQKVAKPQPLLKPEPSPQLIKPQTSVHDRTAVDAHDKAVQQQQAADRDRIAREAHDKAVQQQQAADRDRIAREAHDKAVQQQQAADRDRIAREAHDKVVQQQAADRDRIAREAHDKAVQQQQAAERDRLAREAHDKAVQHQPPPNVVPPKKS